MKNKDQSGFRATGLFLSGFQSIAEPTYIPLKPLTMLYGPNSAGKSAVIDAIGLFENIARRQRPQIMSKVLRWRNRESGSGIPDPDRGKNDQYPCLRVGVAFTVSTDWVEDLDRDVKEYKNWLEQQPHFESLAALVGHEVQIDVGIRSEVLPFAIRAAIDGRPIFESRLGELDDGGSSYRDSSFRREGDEGYDYDNETDGEWGPLRIYPAHDFWGADKKLKSLCEFASTNNDPAVSGYVRQGDGYLDLHGVYCASHRYTDQSELFNFWIEDELYDAFNKSELEHKANKQAAGKRLPRKRVRRVEPSDIEEILGELSVFCRALLQLAAAGLNRVHVSGSRQILVPLEMTLRDDDSPKDAVNHSRPTSSYLSYAKYLTYAETKSKEMGQYYGFTWAGTDHRKDHREVNRWLTATLPSLRGYRLRADAYMSIPLTKKREPFSEMDKFVYRLYLVDAQGRTHEFEDVGSGFSYLFPILVALWDSPWSIIEQPELHLHPAAQCDVADVFIAAKNMGHAALIESHSENLILRILRRIRETTEGRVKEKSLRITPDEVAVLYFDPQSDGTTKVKQLRISRDGDFIDRWPAGFFEERSRELFGE
ncbi:MAG: DUF3696 domain-containing protein [Burkholderiales bacterium]|nr:DUF3696 domain-containing protein [Burkholderiales bacterium]